MTREEAIDCINAIHVQMFNSGNSKWTEACDMAIADMKEMDRLAKSEPVLKEPDRPHGEWKEFTVSTYRGTDEWGEPKWGKGKKCICSRCGRRTVISENFCPNCGADMREGDRNEVD